jgi:sugar lactone lactonase YvrE
VNAPIAGLHFDGAGRAFVSTPRLVAADAPATLSILDTHATTGPARLTAFPSQEANAVAGAPATHLRSVLGFHVDHRNGWLWALDQGFVAGEAEAPAGGQKIVVFDVRTGKVVKTIGLDAVADRAGSFLNDIVVDEARKIAYVSDSGLRSAPANRAAIIVVDFATGRARRVLDRHPAVLPQPGAKVVSHGAEVWPGKPLVLGVNGIALSPDGGTLYWTVTTGTRLHAMPTAPLRDPRTSGAKLGAAVRDLGDVAGNTDGIVTDKAGELYITDVTNNGIVRYDPRTGALALRASDDGVRWPDTPTIGPDGDVVFTASNLNGHFAGQVKAGAERYDLWRLTRD